jgi:hypothetical protein
MQGSERLENLYTKNNMRVEYNQSSNHWIIYLIVCTKVDAYFIKNNGIACESVVQLQ